MKQEKKQKRDLLSFIPAIIAVLVILSWLTWVTVNAYKSKRSKEVLTKVELQVEQARAELMQYETYIEELQIEIEQQEEMLSVMKGEKVKPHFISEKELYKLLSREPALTADDIDRFIFIAKRESTLQWNALRPEILNPLKGNDGGLFQINSKAHPMLWNSFNILSVNGSISAAMALYRKSGFKPWYNKQERKAARQGKYNPKKWRKYITPEVANRIKDIK